MQDLEPSCAELFANLAPEKAFAQDGHGWRDAIKKTPSYPC